MKKRFMSILLTLCMALTLLPTAAYAATKNKSQPSEGWDYLRCMDNYLNIDADGNAELRDKSKTPEGNTKFRIHSYGSDVGAGMFGFELEDGRFLGLELSEDEMFKNPKALNGLRVKALKADFKKYMLRWNINSENEKDIFSMRPRMLQDYVLNASGEKNDDGTHIITWKHVDRGICPAYPVPDAPQHGEFRFIPVLPALFSVKSNNTPYRAKPDGDIIGKLGSGTKVWVTEIEGDWAKVTYKGNTYYMWVWKLKTVNPTATAAVEILSSPTKTTYKIGNGFSTAGLKAVDLTGGIETNVNNKITFYIQESVDAAGGGYILKDEVKIKKGHKFKTKGEAVIIMKYKGKSMGSYWIEVTK
ncbi:hypothetical protein Ana3638_18740 [Anaerocolumna sedimenticola]|uniref:SH3b domain-containing protein n=1 Tax=Anaerocolumna sedimenticola TaxID=2696063 RepID=A0A6P1TQE3_9FIRM|nr:hypothetical protein [Anaerocolumna sedimenticola]QHQ62567.1 hypothetical protein Ana3638_18740 [Anaerocolumna sedimenticola]